MSELHINIDHAGSKGTIVYLSGRGGCLGGRGGFGYVAPPYGAAQEGGGVSTVLTNVREEDPGGVGFFVRGVHCLVVVEVQKLMYDHSPDFSLSLCHVVLSLLLLS